VLLVSVSPGVSAQSSQLEPGANGVGFYGTAEFLDGEFDAAATRLSYSLAAVLDMGARLSIGLGELQGADTNEAGISVFVGAAMLRQRAGAPFTLALDGWYGYTGVRSDYLRENDLNQSSVGYEVRLRAFRDFTLAPWLRVELGLEGIYESRRYTTSLEFTYDAETDPGEPSIDLARFPVVEQVFGGWYGGTLGAHFVLGPASVLTLRTHALINEEPAVRIIPELGLVLSQHGRRE
jgi:hypothetical protein